MKMDKLRQAISNIISDKACGGEFYLMVKNKEKIEIRQADVDGTAQKDLANNFIRAISDKILFNDQMSLLDITAADDRNHAIYRYDLEKVPDQLQHMEVVLTQDKFDKFSFDTDGLSSIIGILIILGVGDKQMALYKHQYPIALYKVDDKWFGLMRGSEDRFKKLDDDILRINYTFEFMRVGGEYYILNLQTLEKFFGFHDAIKNVAKQGIENIVQSDLLEDVSPLLMRLDDITFSRKLVRAASKSPVLGVIPNDKIIEFVTSHPTLKEKLKTTADKKKLKVDTKAAQGLFLKLLNDDFLQSQLTEKYYASQAKDSLDKEPLAEGVQNT
ncbi:MAG: anti-phage protein KwaB [Limnohabitans sp.]